jgi:hypothetical protein
VFLNLPLLLSFLCIFLSWRKNGINSVTKGHMLSFFFKSSRNVQDIFPLVIPRKPKLIPFYAISSSGNKVESNNDFNCSNLVVQFVCHGGLPTHVAHVVDLSKIHVITEEEELEVPPP